MRKYVVFFEIERGRDTYVLGEINASCVGFSSHLSLSVDIADEIISILSGITKSLD